MPFDWKNFLSLAEELAAKTDEASQRTAISRAYYSVFNLAFDRAVSTVGRKPSGERYHQWCWKQYRKTNDKICAQLAMTGDRMKKMREDADYRDAHIRRMDDVVKSILDDARQFLAGLTALDPKYPRP